MKAETLRGRAKRIDTTCPKCGQTLEPDEARSFRVYPCRRCGYYPGKNGGRRRDAGEEQSSVAVRRPSN